MVPEAPSPRPFPSFVDGADAANVLEGGAGEGWQQGWINGWDDWIRDWDDGSSGDASTCVEGKWELEL